MNRQDRGIRIRLGICLFAMISGFAALMARTWQLHLHADGRVARIERHQEATREVLSPQRGTIYDARGRALAVNLNVPSVFADPGRIANPRRFARALGRVLAVSPREILSKIRDRSRRFAWIKRRNDPAVETELNRLDLQGLHILHEGMRLYPERQLAAQVVGLVGVDGEGLEGIERMYDKYLRSQDLVVQNQRDAKGRPIFTDGTVVMEPEPGADIHLTIDAVIQHAVEKELSATARESGAPRAMAVVLDPNDGRVLAMASYPSVNPNRLDRRDPAAIRNRPVEELFEPGSTFKVFTMAAALENGALDPTRSILCQKGTVRVNGKAIRNHVEHDRLTPEEILKYSDNIGMSRIALELGRHKMYPELRKFGFGAETGLDLPGETSGMLKRPGSWMDVDLANISFGQGVGTTAIQLVSAVSVIANGGFKVRPYVVRRARFHDGRELVMERVPSNERMISERTASLMKSWMQGVIEEGGTGVLAKLNGYTAAGKTGTAQKIDAVTRNYSSTKVVSSFMGFAPLAGPRLAAIFVFDEPARADYGGTLAAPVFKRVMEAALEYLRVPHDELEPPAITKAPVKSRESEPAAAVAMRTAEEEGLLPDVRGLTVREVLAKIRNLAVDVKIIGSGVAVRQSPGPGRRLESVKRLEVVFEPLSGTREST